MLATAVMWGTNILVFKGATHDFSPWIFNALRLVLATLTLGILAWLEAKLFPRGSAASVAKVSRLRILTFCLLNGFVYLVLFVKGISLTTAGNTALILASMPMWTAGLSRLFTAERLPRVTWFGLLVTFVGTIIVTTQSSQVSLASKYFVGNLFMLFAALAWASGTVLSRSILDSISPLRLSFISALITTPFHLLIVARDLPQVWHTGISPTGVAAIVYSGVFSTGIAYATWNAGVRMVGASHASIYQNVVTLIAVIGSWIFLHEQPMMVQVFGGSLTLLGLYLMRRGRPA